MTEEQREACEKLAESYPAYYEMRYMNVDTPRLSGAEYLKHGYKAGFQAAQTPEMLILNPIVKGLVEAVTCRCGDIGFFVVPNSYTGDPEQEQCEFCYTNPRSRFKALAPFGKSDD